MFCEIRRVLHRRRGDAHDLAADRDEFERLHDALRGVHRVAGDHGLHADRIVPADADFAHAHLAGLAPRVGVKTSAIFQAHLVCSDVSFCRVANMSPTSKNVT